MAVPVQIRIACQEAQWVLRDPPPHLGIVVALAVVLQARFAIGLAAGPFVAVAVGRIRLA